MSSVTVAAKAALTLLTDERARKRLGWFVVAVFSPMIFFLLFFFSVGSGSPDHNRATVEACFYGTRLPDGAPDEFRDRVSGVHAEFNRLDSATSSANSMMEDGDSLDPIRVKAAFFALNLDDGASSSLTAGSFVECFYTTETRTRTAEEEQPDGTVVESEEEYTVNVPVSLAKAYLNIAALLRREITNEDHNNIEKIYNLIAGTPDSGVISGGASGGGGGGGGGFYEAGGSRNTSLDISAFTDPATKNAADLVAYAVHAWESGWGYVWGCFGNVLTESQFESKLAQYPDGVGSHEEFIRNNWVGGRAADCCGLIKGYGWLNPEALELEYGTNGMPDITANQMYRTASVSGPIDTIPETPGVAVWFDGHIGVYIGNGQVIEAMGTRYGVVKTNLAGGRWTHWLEIEYISYN